MKKRLIALTAAALLAAVALMGVSPSNSLAGGGTEWESKRGTEWESKRGTEWESKRGTEWESKRGTEWE